jgi:hypothetical protein
MTTVYWLVKLRPGVSAEDYQRFVQTVDYPEIQNIASIRSYRSNRVVGSLPGGSVVPFDFIDVVEVDDLEAYVRDLKEHPAVERVHSQSPNLVEVVDCLVTEAVPPQEPGA